jgi:KaiC/GvpD/RAD55 family RecA-like ATPase
MAELTTKPAAKRRSRKPAVATTAAPAATSATGGDLPRGRTSPLDEATADELFRRGVALFNGVRYWHAHEAWETLWRAAPEEERDFYQGLILVAAGLLHVQRRHARGARNKLSEGLAKLRQYQPVHRAIFVEELVGRGERILEDLESGFLPYLIPPVIRFVDLDQSDFDR